MRRRDLGQLYQWKELDHPVPIHIVGPGLKQFFELSRAISLIFAECKDRSTAVRWTSAFVWFLNETARMEPQVAAMLEKSAEDCDRAQTAFVSAIGAEVAWDSQGLDRRWVTVSPEQHLHVSDALIALGMVTNILSRTCYNGKNPFRLNAAELKEAGQPVPKTSKRRRDPLRRIRMAKNGYVVPRFEDPRISERWFAAAKSSGTPPTIAWLARWGRGTGARSGSLLPLTLLDYMKSPKFGELLAPKKGSKGVKNLTLVFPKDETAHFEVYLDGQLRRFNALTVAKARSLATSPAGQRLLAEIPLFSEDGVHAVKYERLARIFRKVAKKAGLVFRSHSGKLRTVSFHHLRHEYVFARLEEIMLADKDHYDSLCRNLISYMGWSKNSEMLEWYSQHFDSIFAVILAKRSRHHEPRREAQPGVTPAPLAPSLRQRLASVL